MSRVLAGRYTADVEGDVTVFLIGMRVNQPWRADRWLPVFAAMPRMLMHLDKHPEVGLLGYHSWFGRTTMMVSYWRSPEHLQRFASDPDAPHLEPWREFRRKVGDNGTVGVWHETYVARAGGREVIYANMPAFGLAKATAPVPVGDATRTARQRLSRA